MSTATRGDVHELLCARRNEVVARAGYRVREGHAPRGSDGGANHDLGMFVNHVCETLSIHASAALLDPRKTDEELAAAATQYGRECLERGLTVAQIVFGYGDVHQVVASMASTGEVKMSADELRVIRRCADHAIAGAMTAYGEQRERQLVAQGTERFGVVTHELRNLLHTAILSFDLLRRGVVEVSGTTGATHARALASLRYLVERSLAEVRMEAGLPVLEHVSLLTFIGEIELAAALHAGAMGLHLTVLTGEDADILVDRQLLASAVNNLLQNAFNYTRAGGSVLLSTRVKGDGVSLEVRDECGGLPPGAEDLLFRPFARPGSDRSSLGLGLSIAMRAVVANRGTLSTRNLPGEGCIFTIELPRAAPRKVEPRGDQR